MTAVLEEIPPAVKQGEYFYYPYKQANRPSEEEIAHKKSLGYKLFKWEVKILERVILRRKLFATQQSCIYCKKELTFDTSTVDHKVPQSKGGTDDLENLCIACERCNVKKGSMSVEEFIASDCGRNLPPSRRMWRNLKAEALRHKRSLNYINFQICYMKGPHLC